MTTIVIDCGNSFIKGARICAGKFHGQARRKAPSPDMAGDILEPRQINALVALVKEMILSLAGEEHEILLCLSNEMHGFVLAASDGTPVTDYISWQREWGGIEIDGWSGMQILQQESLREDLQFTGMAAREGLPSSNLYYLLKRGLPERQQGQFCFYTLGDYVLKRLSGREPLCHPTNAAATGLYDLRTGDWNWRLIHTVSGDELLFPLIGEEEMTFNLEGLLVHSFPAVGDQQAALLGAGLKDEKTISYNIGTGGQVGMLTSAMELSNDYQIRPYFDGMYLKTIPHIPSGRSLNVIVRFVKDVLHCFSVDVEEETLWEVLLQAECQCAETSLLCDLSFFGNAITDQKVGAIFNIEEYGFTLGGLVKSVFYRMADNFTLASQIICPDFENVKKVLFSGGIAEKIYPVRERILERYAKGTTWECAFNETLRGLYQYGMMKRKKENYGQEN